MNTATIAECMNLSFANTPFPDVVKKLADAGVRSYSADLVRLEKTYYGEAETSTSKAMPLTEGPHIAETFDAEGVVTALRAIQQNKIGYAAFLRGIMSAGCSRYSVFFGGRKAIYFGRDGDFYIENFPAAYQ